MTVIEVAEREREKERVMANRGSLFIGRRWDASC